MARRAWKTGLFVIFVAIVAGVVWFFALRPADSVAVVHPMHGPAVQAVYATGTVEPVVMLPLGPRTTGRLVEILADEGYKVEKGQVLARLEDENLRKSLDELQARADLAQKEYERRIALVKDGTVSKEAADRALAERDAAVAAVERAQAELDFLKLIAPASGTIIRRDGEIGEVVTAGEPVFWMSCCDGLRIEAEVDEEDIPLVEPGQKAVIHADAFPEAVFYGSVSSITPKGDPVSRSYRVRIGLAPDTKLMIGMTAESNIVIREEPDALLVPAGAVTDDGKVLTVKDGAVTVTDITIGARTPEVAEVRKGLTESDFVVMNGEEEVEAGARIEPVLKKWKAP